MMDIPRSEMAVHEQAAFGSRASADMVLDRGIFSQMLDIPAAKNLLGELIHVF
jgi:hypothetical protein